MRNKINLIPNKQNTILLLEFSHGRTVARADSTLQSAGIAPPLWLFFWGGGGV